MFTELKEEMTRPLDELAPLEDRGKPNQGKVGHGIIVNYHNEGKLLEIKGIQQV